MYWRRLGGVEHILLLVGTKAVIGVSKWELVCGLAQAGQWRSTCGIAGIKNSRGHVAPISECVGFPTRRDIRVD